MDFTAKDRVRRGRVGSIIDEHLPAAHDFNQR